MLAHVRSEVTARPPGRELGTTLTRAVTEALSEALDRSTPAAIPKLERLKEISRRASRLPVLDARTPDEILGYDDAGLPT